MTDQPQPPVPADADLTDFKFMPLEVARLRRSKAWLICKRRPELAFYMLNLWTAAWHERPAGSLEDDDDVLADAAMCSPDKWQKVRAEVLRGWFKAADGRLYHPVVAEKVMDSWHGKMVARWKKECDRIRKENHRRKEKDLPTLDFPSEPPRTVADFPAERSGIPAENSLKGEGEGEGEERDREVKEESAAADVRAGEPKPSPEIEALDAWNVFAKANSLPTADFPTGTRIYAIASVLKICGGPEAWAKGLKKAETAQFLRSPDGSFHAWFKLDWLLKDDHFAKLLEGQYDHAREKSGGSKQQHETFDQRRIREGRAAVAAVRIP